MDLCEGDCRIQRPAAQWFCEAEKALPGTKESRNEDARDGSALYFITDTDDGEMLNMEGE